MKKWISLLLAVLTASALATAAFASSMGGVVKPNENGDQHRHLWQRQRHLRQALLQGGFRRGEVLRRAVDRLGRLRLWGRFLRPRRLPLRLHGEPVDPRHLRAHCALQPLRG